MLRLIITTAITLYTFTAVANKTASKSNDTAVQFIARNICDFDTPSSKLTVLDLIYKDRIKDEIVFKRRLLNYKRPDIIISEIDLLKPKDYDPTQHALVNTTELPVDYSTVHTGLRSLIASAFVASTLSFVDNSNKKLIEIGLGGSQINNFFHHRFPNMSIQVIELEETIVEIARRYFGLKEDEYQKVSIMDGVDYIRNCSSDIDVLIIDACPTEYPPNKVQLCPVSHFTEPEILLAVKKSLKETGSLIMKLLLNATDVEAEAKKIAVAAENAGFFCTTIDMVNYYNRVLLCKKTDFPERHQDRATVNAHIDQISAKLFDAGN